MKKFQDYLEASAKPQKNWNQLINQKLQDIRQFLKIYDPSSNVLEQVHKLLDDALATMEESVPEESVSEETFHEEKDPDVNDKIDAFMSMILNVEFNDTTYLRGFEALNAKYDLKNDRDLAELKRLIIAYEKNKDSRKLLSRKILREYEFQKG